MFTKREQIAITPLHPLLLLLLLLLSDHLCARDRPRPWRVPRAPEPPGERHHQTQPSERRPRSVTAMAGLASKRVRLTSSGTNSELFLKSGLKKSLICPRFGLNLDQIGTTGINLGFCILSQILVTT